MKMKAIAACVVLGTTSVTAAQDCTIVVDPFGGTVAIYYNGSLPVQQLWSDISFRMTGDAPITITNQSNVYTDILSPTGAVITGNGTNEVTFVGTSGGSIFGGVQNSSNPFTPFTFNYEGSVAGFGCELFGQNTCMFVQAPFGNPINMMNANGTLGPLTFNEVCIPAPASVALLTLAGVGASRRRRSVCSV